MDEGGQISGKYGRSNAQPPTHGPVAALAAGQHAVFSLQQLRELGLSASAVHKRAACGSFHRRYPGVYSLVPAELLTREGHWMAAVLACGPGAVLSHVTAAALHELRRSDSEYVHVTVPGRSRRTLPGLRVHRSTTLTEADVTEAKGIPCTTVARTLFDLAEMISRRGLERAFDQSEILNQFDLRAIEDQLARNPTRRGAGIVRALLEEHYIGSTPTESELEEGFLALCRRAALPQPETQKWLALHDGGPPIRADFLWRAERVVVEVDGVRFHGTHQARPRDARRDQRLTVHDWRPIRTDWRQVFRRPAELEATLRALVRRPSRRSRSRPRVASGS